MSTYTFDASAFINTARRYHPIDVFRTLWERIDELIGEGRLLVAMQVHEEVSKTDDLLSRWLSVPARKGPLFIEADEQIQLAQQEIVRRYPKWPFIVRSSQWADPWVIATAQVKDLIVVHYETRPGSSDHPSIRRVCDDLKLPQLSFVELLRREGWTF